MKNPLKDFSRKLHIYLESIKIKKERYAVIVITNRW